MNRLVVARGSSQSSCWLTEVTMPRKTSGYRGSRASIQLSIPQADRVGRAVRRDLCQKGYSGVLGETGD